MGVKEDLVAAQKLLGDNEKAQLQATRDALAALVVAGNANLTNLPDAQGVPSRISEFISKSINNTQGLVNEADYLLGLYPKAEGAPVAPPPA